MIINSRSQTPFRTPNQPPAATAASGTTTPATSQSQDSVQLGGTPSDTNTITIPGRVVRAAHRNQVVALGISAMGLTAAATGHPAVGLAATALGIGCFATLKNFTDNLK